MTAAAPIPLPMHMLVHKTWSLWRRSCARPVTTWRAPAERQYLLFTQGAIQNQNSLIPSGCVNEIDEPLYQVWA